MFETEFLGFCHEVRQAEQRTLVVAASTAPPAADVPRQQLRELLLAQPDRQCDDEAFTTLLPSERKEILFLDFDTVVGADGGKSVVRQALGIPVRKYDTYSWNVSVENIPPSSKDDTGELTTPVRSSITKSGIRQVSILMNFKPRAAHDTNSEEEDRCPKMRTDADGHTLDPWAIGFHPVAGTAPSSLPSTLTPQTTNLNNKHRHRRSPTNGETEIDGVYAVFKRFYYETCQLQLLFLHEQVVICYCQLALNEFRKYSLTNVFACGGGWLVRAKKSFPGFETWDKKLRRDCQMEQTMAFRGRHCCALPMPCLPNRIRQFSNFRIAWSTTTQFQRTTPSTHILCVTEVNLIASTKHCSQDHLCGSSISDYNRHHQ